MLIIDNRKDYYDGIVNTVGIDKTIVYNRHEIEIQENFYTKIFNTKTYLHKKHKDNPFFNLAHYSINKTKIDLYQHQSHFIIGFCGKLYIGWKLYNDKMCKVDITYDFDLVNSLINPNSYYGKFIDNVNLIKNYNAIHLFRDYKTPIFIYDGDYNRTENIYYCRNVRKFIINPILKDYEFYKMFDSFQAFQEIQMFIGGVLGSNEKDIVEISDKHKIQQHGFDYKYSFRKDKKQ